MFLTDEEIKELTGRERTSAQVRQLRHMGIDHRVRADGSIAVLKSHIDKIFGGVSDMPVKSKRVGPNWAGVC